MRINSIEIKNFTSYGNHPQKIEFSEDGLLHLLTAPNGSGKSSLSNAIVFAIYGKVEGFKLGDLPNRINGELLVKIELTCGSKDVVIERGIAPNVFNLWVNGIEYDRAGKSNVQDYIENELIGIPFHVFKNIIILSVNDFKSFITMNSSDKKKIIDKIFGFSIINEMFQKVKERRKEVKLKLNEYNASINQLKDSIEKLKSSIQNLKDKEKEVSEERLKGLKEELQERENNLIDLQEKFKDLSGKSTKLNEANDKLYKAKVDRNSTAKQLKNSLALYENSQCPTCKSPLDTDEHLELKKKLEEELKSIIDEYKKYSDKLEEVKTKQEKLKQGENKLNQLLNVTSSEIKGLEHKIQLEKNVDNTDSIHEFQDLQKKFTNDVKDNAKKVLVSKEQDSFYEVVEEILSENGVKQLIIKNILPVLNSNIKFLCKEMHLHFNIEFDENFDCNISYVGSKVNPSTMSTGEKKKVDFAVLIAIIEIFKKKYPQMNLLFLDEIFSSVDEDGRYAILKILGSRIKDLGINTFVINHSVLPSELFDKHMTIVKENGFSKIQQSVIE